MADQLNAANEASLLAQQLGRYGFDHITGTSTVSADDTDGNFDHWHLIIPANGTSPTLADGTTSVRGDDPVNGESVPSGGLKGVFDNITLGTGEVYAYRAGN